MANRMISYGYGVKDGVLVVIDHESQIVNRIFQEYIDGKMLGEIATELTQEHVEYFLGNCSWNKSRIDRIIDNEKYIGADGYPQIVNDDVFMYAKKLKDGKGAKKKHFDEPIEYLRNNKVTCSQCGGHIRRISTWRSREKWLCRDGCKNDIYLSDDVIFSGIKAIVYKIVSNPDCIIPINEDKPNSIEVRRTMSEINRLFNEKNPTFSAGKKLIFHLAETRFELYDEKTPDVYTDMIVEDCNRVKTMDRVDKQFMEKYCEQISVDKRGYVSIHFVNGAEVSSKEEV